ncbi:MAG: HAMP domain-containing histidine kinase [Lachnospiraceae bacterium]|nr:HAMP domain-containing histidine kinase [Lachnospiraceae bacterium]
MKKGSIRLKLTLWLSLVLIALVGIAEILLLSVSRKAARDANEEALKTTLEMNAGLTSFKYDYDALFYHDGAGIRYAEGYLLVSRDFERIRNNVYTGLFTADAELLYGQDPLQGQTDFTLALANSYRETAKDTGSEPEYPFTEARIYTVEKDGIRYRVYDKMIYMLYGTRRIWIRSVISDEQSNLQIRNLFRSSMYIIPALIVLSILFSYLLAGRLLKPIRELETETEKISRGEDLKKRLDVGERDDEIGRLTGAFNRMLDRLENSFETERRFTSDASHELRTPTSVILTQSEYMLEQMRLPQEYREGFETVKKQGERMNTLITDMLDFTRMEQGTEQYPFEEVDLSALVKETSDEMAKLKTRGIALESDVQQGVTLNGNRALLSRMLTNLISNAYCYGTDNGFIRVRLEKTKKTGEDAPAEGSAEEKIVLTVADNGIGIPEEDLPKIFDRFYRVDPSRTNPGSGLGLSMVKHIADMHHADVLVESEEGSGTVFRVVF